MNKPHLIGALCAVVFSFITLPSHAALVSWDIDINGQLLGANNVDVNGVLYDVQFIDGTCSQVYGACETSSFTIQIAATAQAASQALVDQVFLDGISGGSFDTMSDETNGCDSFLCNVFTPYAVNGSNLEAYFVNNGNGIGGVVTGPNGLALDYDTTTDSQIVYASWTVQAVPIPATVWLFGSGLLGLIGVARRKPA